MATTETRRDGTTYTSYSTKETAAFIRAALKAAFPGVAFSVRISLYSMGSSTYVSWTDGPTEPEVDAVTNRFTSRTFDGSDDSTHFHDQVVDGQRVQYCGYISLSRKFSPAFVALGQRKAALLGEENYYAVLHTLRPNGCRVTLKEAR